MTIADKLAALIHQMTTELRQQDHWVGELSLLHQQLIAEEAAQQEAHQASAQALDTERKALESLVEE